MNSQFFVGPKGAEVHFLCDGEITRTIQLPAGAYACASFEKLRRSGETVGYPVPVLRSFGNGRNIKHPGAFDSSANPSFRVTPAQWQAKQLQQMMQRTEQLAKRANKALQAARRAKKDVPQIEHTPDLPAKVDAGDIPAT